MNKLMKKIAALALGITMAAGVGVGVFITRNVVAEQTKADAGAVTTFTINISNVKSAGTTWPTSYSNTEVTWSFTSNNITIDFAAANFTTGTGGNAGTMQNRTNNAGCSYIRSTGLTAGYAIKSVQGFSGGAKNWDFYGAISPISVKSGNPNTISGGTKVGDTNTTDAEHPFGSGNTYDSINYPYTNFAMTRVGSGAGYYTKFVVKVVELAPADPITSISIKKAPNKTTYISGEKFDATGLIITANRESMDPEDIPYEGNENLFSFDPEIINNSGNVTIKYYDKTTTQAVTVAQVKNITGVNSAPTSVEKDGSIELQDVILDAELSDGETTTVNPTKLEYSTAALGKTTVKATYEPATGTKDVTFTIEVTCIATYDLTKISGFNNWGNSYTQHTVKSTSIDDATVEATLDFKIASKQTNATCPVIASKTVSEIVALNFVLEEAGMKITSIEIGFLKRSSNTPSFYLHKGSDLTGTLLGTIDIGTESEYVLSCQNLNDTNFTIGYNGHNANSNKSADMKYIKIGLAKAGGFGDLDHISVAKAPEVSVYHVGEPLSYKGLAVTAYDGEDESTSNFKDVTEDVTLSIEEGYVFVDDDIGEFVVNVSYETKDCELPFTVYSKAEYELVTTVPTDWSGNYIIVASYTDLSEKTHNVAMTSTLSNFDAVHNFKEITINSTTIEAGQESEFTFAACGDGYSIQGKSGKYFYGMSTDNNGLTTSDTPVANKIEQGANGHFKITYNNRYLNVKGEEGLERFRYYNNGDGVKLYKLKESSQAGEYADAFLNEKLCDGGKTAPSTTIWENLATSYASLSKADKELFRLGVSSQTGTNIQQCLARYDEIINKYGVDTYNDFMNRFPDGVVPSSHVVGLSDNDNAMLITVIVVSVLTAATVGGYFFIRKKKHSN
ncbi:MAG: hypothetical protein MJ227_03325 [Bacilli bacterium]|nr:hypothetical protein [Bacilli bacterium]